MGHGRLQGHRTDPTEQRPSPRPLAISCADADVRWLVNVRLNSLLIYT